MPPIIEDAARRGIITAIFVLLFFGLGHMGGIGALLSMAAGIAGVVYVVRSQRKFDSKEQQAGEKVSWAVLAAYGVAVSFFASLLVAVVVYGSLRLQPDFIVNQLEATIQVLSTMPEYSELRMQFENMIEQGHVPTAVDMMCSVLIMMMFTGLAIGIVGATIAKISNRRYK
ncbi:MAG: DUF4199 domain-containing protein [Muribaculaceae bacterium]|nr:DUF4199 domain-containing protein [Muribaculaceae bacterium]